MADPIPEPRPLVRKPIRLAPAPARPNPIITTGRRWSPHEDFYHWILTRSWPQFFGIVGLTFVVLNALFALAYLSVPGAIANLPPGSFEDAFYFSVQTLATIGYGVMSPASRAGHLLVAFEALTGMLSVAMMTGLTFAKFTRPTARVLFAQKVTLTPRAGVPHLMFRLANWRGNQMIDVQLKIVVLRTERTPEGDTTRIPVEVKLVRDRTMLFMLTWVPMHRIDETSPFYGPDAMDRLRAENTEMFVSLTGYDETIGQTVHVRHSYKLDDIVPNMRFADVLETQEDGTRVLRYENFHELVPLQIVEKRAVESPASRQISTLDQGGGPELQDIGTVETTEAGGEAMKGRADERAAAETVN